MAFLLLFLLLFLQQSQCYDRYRSLNYSASNPSFVNRTLVTSSVVGPSNSDVNKTTDAWNINPTDANKFRWALWVFMCIVYITIFTSMHLQALIGSQKSGNPGDLSWGFHPNFTSTIAITIYGTSETQSTDGDRDLLISIASGDLNDAPQIRHISALIQLDASNDFNNKISPSCSGSEQLNLGSPVPIDDTNSTKSRWQVVMGEDNMNNLDDWSPPNGLSGTRWPITFEVTNYPELDQSTFKLITPGYTQTCSFAEAFKTNAQEVPKGLDVFINGGNSSEQITIKKFEFEYFYNFPTQSPTTNPTKSPSSNPTTNPTQIPTTHPTKGPTTQPTSDPTIHPTENPTQNPTDNPTTVPTVHPTKVPSVSPTKHPTTQPTTNPTMYPTVDPTMGPTFNPTADPTFDPTADPTIDPTIDPTSDPTIDPTKDPTSDPTIDPTADPTIDPTRDPTSDPTIDPTANPTMDPTIDPTEDPTIDPTADPTMDPTSDPTTDPTRDPTASPTLLPTPAPTGAPTFRPTYKPTLKPTRKPTGTPDPTKAPTTRRPSRSPTPQPTKAVNALDVFAASTHEIVTVVVALLIFAITFLIAALIQRFQATRQRKLIFSAEDDRDGDGRRDDFGSIDGLHLFAADAVALETETKEEEEDEEDEGTDEEERINRWFANQEENGLLEEVPNDPNWDWETRERLRNKFEAQFEGSASSDL